MTEPINQKHLHRLTYWTKYSKEVREELSKKNNSTIQQFTVIEDSNSGSKIKGKMYGWALYMCCLRKHIENQEKEAECKEDVQEKIEEAHLASRKAIENPVYSRINNIIAVIIVIIATSIYVYYA